MSIFNGQHFYFAESTAGHECVCVCARWLCTSARCHCDISFSIIRKHAASLCSSNLDQCRVAQMPFFPLNIPTNHRHIFFSDDYSEFKNTISSVCQPWNLSNSYDKWTNPSAIWYILLSQTIFSLAKYIRFAAGCACVCALISIYIFVHKRRIRRRGNKTKTCRFTHQRFLYRYVCGAAMVI